MPLLVTALVVKNNDVELAIVDVDILLFTPEQDQEIRQLISTSNCALLDITMNQTSHSEYQCKNL